MHLTVEAALYLDRIRRGSELPETAGVRISERPGPAGRRVEVAFVVEPRTGDIVVARAGARVFLDPAIAPSLAEALIDLDGGVEPPELVLRSARSIRGSEDTAGAPASGG